jgi:SAM-dependent methyltransferase
MPNNHFSGVDISNTSIKVCREKDLDCREYDGKHLPYPDASFDIVGSINVLEHVDDPAAFLNELLRVLKPGGHLITACPNFLAVTNGYHHHTRGYLQKIKNIHGLLSRLLARQPKWEKMQTISRVDFHADDDACNVTNPVDILRWGRNRFLTKVHWSSQTIYRKGILNMLDRIAPFRLILGSSFIVFRK